MRTRSICHRCHRLRVVCDTRYCVGCTSDLRGMEQRRPSPPEMSPELEPKEAAVFVGNDALNPTLCELPVDKPRIDEGSGLRWRQCPNPATKRIEDVDGPSLRVCEEHFVKEAVAAVVESGPSPLETDVTEHVFPGLFDPPKEGP